MAAVVVVVVRVRVLILELEPSVALECHSSWQGQRLIYLVSLDFHFVWHAQYWQLRTGFNVFQYTMRPWSAKSKHCQWAGCGWRVHSRTMLGSWLESRPGVDVSYFLLRASKCHFSWQAQFRMKSQIMKSSQMKIGCSRLRNEDLANPPSS